MKRCVIAAVAIAGMVFEISPAPVTPVAGGVVVDAPAARVRVVDMGRGVMRVTAVPAGHDFPADNSLIITGELQPSKDVKIKKGRNEVTLAGAGIKAAINRATGCVTVTDGAGRLLVRETGRDFTPVTVDVTEALTVRQRWASLDPDEGIYGLGQHQSDEFNYRGKNEQLFQYNTKVSVPMIVSTSGYGILWDSYSLCRWGRPDDFADLGDVFTLRDASGREGALTGLYVGERGDTLRRREERINFEHLITGDLGHVNGLPRDFKFKRSHVTYTGTIEPRATGIYDFSMYYSGYQRITIDGREVVPERWRTSWNPNTYKFSVSLTEGKPAAITIDWEPNGDVAYCGLRAYAPAADSDLSMWGEMQTAIDYYVIAGETIDSVIGGYRALTGHAPVMPRWAMGYWQSREKYNTQRELLDVVGEFRRRQIPLDNIVLDWLHWPQDAWGSHEFDGKRFPDPRAMIDSVHAMDARIMVSVWPKFYVTTDHYREMDEHGWMYRRAVDDSIRDWVGPGYLGSFYDAYSEPARRLFWSQINDHYMPLGIDAWWMDASEPNVRDCTDMDYRKALCGPTALGPSTQYFNAYALMNAEAIYRGQREADPSRRVFLLTRSGFAGLQRYSTATWSGDIATRWEDMKAQISAGLNFSLSGIPWWTMDIGGFCVEDRYVAAMKAFNKQGIGSDDLDEWRELNARWYQFGAFAPLFRAHGQWPRREVWNIAPEGHPVHESIVGYTRLRYRLMPYIYSLAGMAHFDDYTPMRAMVMDFGSDKVTRNIGDQFMLGPSLLVAPVYTYGARSRSVYLPEGSSWYDFHTSRPVEGCGYVTLDAPLERMPLLVKAGSILVTGEGSPQSTVEAARLPLTVTVYTGADAAFTLYDDDGVSYAYESGAYARIPLKYDHAASTLTIGDAVGSYPVNKPVNIIKVTPEGRCDMGSVTYTGQTITVNLR